MSRHHLDLYIKGPKIKSLQDQIPGQVEVVDAGSSHGTLVDSVKIKANEKFALKPGSTIQIGKSTLELKEVPLFVAWLSSKALSDEVKNALQVLGTTCHSPKFRCSPLRS